MILKIDVFFNSLLNVQESENLIKTFFTGKFTVEDCEAPLRKIAYLEMEADGDIWNHILATEYTFSNEFKCKPVVRIFLSKDDVINSFAQECVSFNTICQNKIKFNSQEMFQVLKENSCDVKSIEIYFEGGLDIFSAKILPYGHSEKVSLDITKDGCKITDLSCGKINVGYSVTMNSLAENIIKCTEGKPMHDDNTLKQKINRIKDSVVAAASFF